MQTIKIEGVRFHLMDNQTVIFTGDADPSCITLEDLDGDGVRYIISFYSCLVEMPNAERKWEDDVHFTDYQMRWLLSRDDLKEIMEGISRVLHHEEGN